MAEKLLNRLRGVIRAKHHSYRTEEAHVQRVGSPPKTNRR